MMRDVIGRVAPWVQMNWDWRAAGNFIGGGTGAGLLITSMALGYRPAALVILLGLGCVGAGLSCVWAEIGRPWRALNVLRHAATSWMTREALVAIGVFACGAAALLDADTPRRVLLALFAAAFLNCQARMLQAAKGIPAWRHPRIVPLIFTTGLAEGAGLLLLCAGFAGRDWLPQWAGVLLALLLVARLARWTAYRHGVHASGAPRAALAALDRMSPWVLAVDLAGCVLALSTLLPALSVWSRPMAGALALGGGWTLKWSILRRAAFTQGFALAGAPERGVGGVGPPARPGWN